MFKKEQGKQIIQQHIETQNILKRYIKGNLLGKGGFAKCYQFVSQQTNKKYAAKIIQKSSLTKPKAKQKLQSQIKIHKSLHHFRIVNFEHFFQDQEYVYILLQICRPQTLNDLLKRRKRITQFQVKFYIYQIVEALKYVHGRKVIHRDLKLGNIFLNDQLNIKVGDFGLAAKINYDNQKKKTTCGTPNYLAPQILTSKSGYSYEVDIWSVGVIAYALLFGRPPFQTNDLKLTYSKIKSCNYSIPENVNVSSTAKKFITKILQLQPHKRPTLDQIFEDQFISSIQIPKSLPLATISIPPSANFIRKYQKSTDSNQSQNKNISQQNVCLNSYRTLDRNKIMMSTDKLQICEKRDILKKEASKQNILMQRAASTAGLLQSKKATNSLHKEPMLNKQISKDQIPVRVLLYQQNPKFGISYMLSTNAFGMRYNDSTCVVTNSFQSQIKYLTVQSSNFKQVSFNIYNFNQTPQSLSKKMKIINHYMKELKKKKNQIEQKMSNQLRIQLQKMKSKQTNQNMFRIYLVRSLKTSKAQFFEFNNGNVQVIFEDSSQIVFKNINNEIIPRQQLVTYITKFSQLKQFKISSLQEQGEDIKKRMNYSLNVIGRVKKSLENKEVAFKQNRIVSIQNNSSRQNINKSIDKQKSITMGRSSSTFKLGMHQTQSLLSKENTRHFNSTAKLLKPMGSVKQMGSSNALRQISNKNY